MCGVYACVQDFFQTINYYARKLGCVYFCIMELIGSVLLMCVCVCLIVSCFLLLQAVDLSMSADVLGGVRSKR